MWLFFDYNSGFYRHSVTRLSSANQRLVVLQLQNLSRLNGVGYNHFFCQEVLVLVIKEVRVIFLELNKISVLCLN